MSVWECEKTCQLGRLIAAETERDRANERAEKAEATVAFLNDALNKSDLARAVERREREVWVQAFVSVVGETVARQIFQGELARGAHPEPVAEEEEG